MTVRHGASTSRVILCLFAALLYGPVTGAARADDWMRPEPISFHSRGFSYVAEIFPPHSRQNPGDQPRCFLYEIGYPGTDWKIDARLSWDATLVNDQMPYQAVISPDGDVVTLNEWGRVGYQNAVALYRRDGTLLRAYALEELLPPAAISSNENEAKIRMSTSSRWWTDNAKYYFLKEPARFYVVLPWGSGLEFRLDSGKVSYGRVASFADLAALRRKDATDAAAGRFGSVNEEAEVSATSLRFSSITDVLAAKAGAR